MGQIVIELLSDSCISSGETYNSSIDSDVCYDSYGLPYIPAKRIRGCLREAGLELQDFGIDIDVDALFGKPGNSVAAFVLGNAKLQDYEMYIGQLNNCGRAEYTHRQTVLNQFTYIRYQTGIDRESGTAEETSLRAVRVMKKDLIFVADIEVKPKYEETIRLCCQNLRSMGMNRTRGMGEVRVDFLQHSQDKMQPKHVKWVEGKTYERLDYQIRLKSPMLIKSVAGGQTKTVPYIGGAKILGLLAQNLGGDGLIRLQEQGRLICANAYISDGTKRYTPVSASLYGIKNEKEAVRDRACRSAEKKGIDEGKQLMQLAESYVDSDTEETINRLTVDTEIRYHHARPGDKSLGHVVSEEGNSPDGGSFYQMESIAEGQLFSGYILGSVQQLKTVYDVLTEKPIQHLGYGKTSEYGEAELTVTSLGVEKTAEQPCSSFVVKLNAPVILYNENGMYDTDEKLLLNYITEAVRERNNLPQLPVLEITNRFLRYCTVGGFNTTWGLHKPVINTFDAGTTLVIAVKGQTGPDIVDIGKMKNVFVGERLSEGYGEAVFYPEPSVYEKSFTDPTITGEQGGTTLEMAENTLIQKIATGRAYAHIKEQARKHASGIRTENETFNTVIANLLMMCRQQETFANFQENIKTRFDKDTEKNEKYETAKKIISPEFRIADVMEDARKAYPEAVLAENDVYKTYVTALLVALKYKVRREKE